MPNFPANLFSHIISISGGCIPGLRELRMDITMGDEIDDFLPRSLKLIGPELQTLGPHLGWTSESSTNFRFATLTCHLYSCKIGNIIWKGMTSVVALYSVYSIALLSTVSN